MSFHEGQNGLDPARRTLPSVTHFRSRMPKRNSPSSALDELGPSERREGGSLRSAIPDHINRTAAVQFRSLF